MKNRVDSLEKVAIGENRVTCETCKHRFPACNTRHVKKRELTCVVKIRSHRNSSKYEKVDVFNIRSLFDSNWF